MGIGDGVEEKRGAVKMAPQKEEEEEGEEEEEEGRRVGYLCNFTCLNFILYI